MTETCECPNCGAILRYQEAEFGAGLYIAGWVCEVCDVFVDAEDEPADAA